MSFKTLRRSHALAAVALLAFVAPAIAADDDGYVSLFNGKDLTGWKLHPETNKGAIASFEEKKVDGKVVAIVGKVFTDRAKKETKDVTLWEVKDGLLIGGGPMSHLYYEKADYKNFLFRVNVKINDKGNSGVFFRAGFRGGVPKGYEAQLNATHSDRVKTGSIYPNGEFGLDKYKAVTCVMDKAAHKPDEFFNYEISAIDARLVTNVNGAPQIAWIDPEHRFKDGQFALQAHDPGSVMTFRKVEVKILP